MEIVQYITIIATLLAGFGFICREIKTMRQEMREDINLHKEDIRQNGSRTDKLYEMLIDIIKKGGAL